MEALIVFYLININHLVVKLSTMTKQVSMPVIRLKMLLLIDLDYQPTIKTFTSVLFLIVQLITTIAMSVQLTQAWEVPISSLCIIGLFLLLKLI